MYGGCRTTPRENNTFCSSIAPHEGPDAINIAKLVQRRGVQTKWRFLNEFCEVSVRKPAKSLS